MFRQSPWFNRLLGPGGSSLKGGSDREGVACRVRSSPTPEEACFKDALKNEPKRTTERWKEYAPAREIETSAKTFSSESGASVRGCACTPVPLATPSPASKAYTAQTWTAGL